MEASLRWGRITSCLQRGLLCWWRILFPKGRSRLEDKSRWRKRAAGPGKKGSSLARAQDRDRPEDKRGDDDVGPKVRRMAGRTDMDCQRFRSGEDPGNLLR